MTRPLTDIDKIIQYNINKIDPKNKIKVLFFKIDSHGDIFLKHGYLIKERNFRKNNPLIFININATTYSDIKITAATEEGVVYRNSVWYIENNNINECLFKAIDAFKKSKQIQLSKLNQQISLLKKEIKRINKLKESYQEKIDNGEAVQLRP